MTWAAAAFIVLGFMAIAQLLRIPARAGEAVNQSKSALTILRNKELDELEKEKAVQAFATRLFLLFLVLTVTAAIALAIPIGIVWLGDLMGIVDFEQALDQTLSWQVLLGATVLGGLILLIPRKQDS